MKRKLDNTAQFFFVAILAAILAQVPVAGWPLLWFTTYFYETSQCLTASATGGITEGLALHWQGTGSCESSGGVAWLKALMGYPGMMIFGALCYFSVATAFPKKAYGVIALLLVVILSSLLLFSRTFAAGIILSLMAALVGSLFIWRRKLAMRIGFKALAIGIVVQSVAMPILAIKSPSDDALFLSMASHLPTMVFNFVWICFGIFGLQYLWRFHRWRGW